MPSPILGIIAAQNYPRITTSFESIATVSVGSGGAADITFSSIPSDYTHLQIRGILFTVSTDNYALVQINGDTGSNYKTHILSGNGVDPGVFVPSDATNGVFFGKSYAVNDTRPTGVVMDILDYKNTNKYKTLRTLGGNDRNGTGDVTLASNLWMSTSAITSIKLYSTVNWKQYTTLALYGIKGA